MRRTLLILTTGSALLLAGCTSDLDPRVADAGEPRSFPSAAPTTEAAGSSVEQVVQAVLPAVVNVEADQGEGTGFIVREDGIVVTNFHVVEGASEITVFTSDEDPDRYDARVIGGDIQADLAVLDIDAEGLPTVPLGDSDGLNLGQDVVALGYALGFEGGPSVTAGIVSSLSRRITVTDPGCPVADCGTDQTRVYTDVIQTDAAINPGNSGGPLVDLAGNVVGINTAGTSAAENIGFAIQINSAKPTIFQAAEEPGAPVPFMGVGTVDAADPEAQFELNPPVDEGAVVVNVVPGGPAEEAGVEMGDVIVSFGGEPTSTAVALGDAIRSHEPGDRVEFEVVRSDGEGVTLSVVLDVNPAAIG